MLCIFTTTSVLAQEFIESVYLKDGSVIKGDIIEVKPNQYLKIEADNGNSIICQYSEIDKITRERTENLTSSQSSCRGYLTRGYRWFIQGEFMALELLGGAITTVHGYQLNAHLFVGGGAGFRVADDWWRFNHISIPLFANVTYDIMDNNSSPYIKLNSGVCIPIEGKFGFYGAAAIGGRFKRISLDAGVEVAPGKRESYETNYYPENSDNEYKVSYYEKYNAINFVARIGVHF